MSIKVREAHWQVLLECMVENPLIATGKFVGPKGRDNYKKLWDDAVQRLNSLGFGSKSTERWQKTWSDYKYHLKKKAANVKKNLTQTGGDTAGESTLTVLELKILDILGENFIALDEPEIGLPLTVEDPESIPGPSGIHSPTGGGQSPQIGQKRKRESTPPRKQARVQRETTPPKQERQSSPPRQAVPYLWEYTETLVELREIRNTLQTSLDGIGTILLGLTDEVRQLNNNLAQILQAQFQAQE